MFDVREKKEETGSCLIIIDSDTRLPGLSVQSHIHDIVPGTACLNSLPLFFVGLTVASKNNKTILNGECKQSKHAVLKVGLSGD